jgi:hypothetical protein
VKLINNAPCTHGRVFAGDHCAATALAKTVADLTCSQNGTVRQQIIETLMREIMEYDAEFGREDASGAVTSVARH